LAVEKNKPPTIKETVKAVTDTKLQYIAGCCKQGGTYVILSVWKSMKRLHIKGDVRRRKYSSPLGNEHKIYPNLLNRSFYADFPLQKIVSDITYIKYRGKWFFLVCFLDLFNNEVLEWELSNTFDNRFVIHTARRLLEKAKNTNYPILLHSDQGNQYSSSGYCALLKEYNAVQSMSRAGTPRDNAVMESFFGRFKDVLRFQFRYWEQDDLFAVISKAIHYFNNIRPIRKLNGKPPVLLEKNGWLNPAFSVYYLLTISTLIGRAVLFYFVHIIVVSYVIYTGRSDIMEILYGLIAIGTVAIGLLVVMFFRLPQ
jgi:transposase InsO family protein